MSDKQGTGSEPFVELNRQFRKLKPEAKAEEAAFESYTADLLYGHNKTFSWDSLLNEYRAVVLGEPGSGKSWEFVNRVRILKSKGEVAFFIRLDQLIEKDLQALLNDDEKSQFARWRTGGETAHFFLDSVDEAKFRKVSDFHAILERFRNTLGFAALTRAKIFLSSRISEWQYLSDEFQLRQLFPAPLVKSRNANSKEIKVQEDSLLVVCIEPLTRLQAELLAEAKMVSNVPHFIQALDTAYAWEFARRPLDVADLIGFWKENNRIGSLSELIEFDVTSKLRERSNRTEFSLSDEKKREGVEWLAAASVLSRKFSFFVPDDDSSDTDSLHALACLPPDWRNEEARALLTRAIFDSAVYGRLRFHHRRVGEYLAAKWIAKRMELGCLLLDLERILFEIVRGRKVLRPSLRPIAAWLCHGNARWNQNVKGLILETDPKIHLKYGDPASLSIEYRKQILIALSNLSRNRKRIWIDSLPECLARIAAPALSSDIAALILDSELADDFRIELLEIVKHGRLVACADAAICIIVAPGESDQIKSHAATTVGSLEDAQLRKLLFKIVMTLQSVPSSLCTSVIQTLFPGTISSAELCQLLEKTESVREFGVDLPYFFETHLQKVLTVHEAGNLLRQLLNLAESPPFLKKGNSTLRISEQFWWIGKVIPDVAEILLEKQFLLDDEVETSARALQFLCHFRERWAYNRENVNELNNKTIPHPKVRQNFLWRMASEFRDERKTEPENGLHISGYSRLIIFSPEDFHWLIDAARTRTDSNDRVLALRLAIEAWDAGGRKYRQYWALRRATKSDALLYSIFRQSVYAKPLFPLKRFWYSRIRFKYGKWWWRNKLDSTKGSFRWLQGQYILLKNLRLLESGKPLGWLQMLLHEAYEKNQNDRWATTSWSGLEKRRGKWITNATKRGCSAMWRGYCPQLPHEKPARNSTNVQVLIGLTGLEIELGGNPEAVQKLTADEAKLAARYAMDELNGFSTWFDGLANVHPKAASEVLCECIEAEWQSPIDRADTPEVLRKVAWRGENLIPLVQDKLLSLLNSGDPQNYSVLQFTLSILTRSPNPPLNHLAILAPQRISANSKVNTMILWLAVWMQIDGMAAINYLQSALPNFQNAREIIEGLCSLLFNDGVQRAPALANPSYLEPRCLRRFIPLIYNYVKFSDDIDRSSGGAYSPTARDHAQRFRGVLLDYLGKSEALEATNFLRELADEAPMLQVRDWILNLLEQRLEKEADSEPWTPADLRDFAARNEFDPKNDTELFSIACKRLLISKDDVERSDNSLRDEIQKDAPEMQLRRWLQRKLNERSQNRYTVPQEEEIDRQERPDLRLENPKTGPVSIEVKWADNWTLDVLLERLENQLVGQYLRAHNSRYGIYLLGFIGNGNRNHWEDSSTGKRLTFDEMVEAVKQRALLLMQTNLKIAGLEVISINFCDLVATSKRSSK